jgi:hypothetical protein
LLNNTFHNGGVVDYCLNDNLEHVFKNPVGGVQKLVEIANFEVDVQDDV